MTFIDPLSDSILKITVRDSYSNQPPNLKLKNHQMQISCFLFEWWRLYKVRLVFPLYQYLGRCPFKQNFLTPEKHAYFETLNIPPPNLFLGVWFFNVKCLVYCYHTYQNCILKKSNIETVMQFVAYYENIGLQKYSAVNELSWPLWRSGGRSLKFAVFCTRYDVIQSLLLEFYVDLI